MILANKNNERIYASPKEKALCPICNEEVISKCGDIKVWHWAHKQDTTCYSFEPETEKHIEMKMFMKKKYPFFKLEYNLKFAIPDLYSSEKRIAIEVQHSVITKETFLLRTKNYSRNNIYVLWIFDEKLLKENCPEFIREAHKLYLGRVYVYKNKKIFPVHFEKKKRYVKINTSFCNILPEYEDEEGNEYIITNYKQKRKYFYGKEVNYNSFMKMNNPFTNELIFKYDDKKWWN